MSDLKIETSLAPSAHDVRELYQAVHTENQKRSDRAEVQVRPAFKYLFLRDEKEKIVGGLGAHFVFDVLYIDVIWVHEEYRRRGEGERLYVAVEKLAVSQGKKRAIVTTFEYQNSTSFWLSLGFLKFAELPGSIDGSRIMYFSKAI